jgi:hypothetical protein
MIHGYASRMLFRCVVLTTVLFSGACSAKLPDPYVIEDLRVLAIVAEPPEIRPGDTARVTVYVAHPQNESSPFVRFSRCPVRLANEGDFVCEENAALTLSEGFAKPEGNGLSSFTFEYVAPTDVLDARDTFREVLLAHTELGPEHTDALKRIVISRSFQRNKNPVLNAVYFVRGEPVAPSGIAAGSEYIVVPDHDPNALESYALEDDDGENQLLIEEPFFSWSCAGGCAIDTPVSYAFSSITFTPNEETSALYLVMRDGRGGEAFYAVGIR